MGSGKGDKMNSQIGMMVLVVEGSRGPPVRKKKVVCFALTAIIKIHNADSNYQGEQEMKTTIATKYQRIFTPPPNYNENDRAPPD